jgi:hypothetical protein
MTFHDENEVSSFAESLKRYSLTLPDEERHLLYELLLRAMEPLDRFRYRSASDLLTEDEQIALQCLTDKR